MYKNRKFLTLLLLLCMAFIPFKSVFAEQIADQQGVLHNVPEKLEKLAVLFPQSFGLVYILDLSDKLVGIPKNNLRVARTPDSPFCAKFVPQVYKAADVGSPGKPNMETIFKLKPDLVLSLTHVPQMGKFNKLMNNNGIPAFTVKAGFGSMQDWLEAVEKVGKMTGKENEALKYIDYVNLKSDFIKNRLSGVEYEKRPKVVLVNTFGGQMSIRGARTNFASSLIELAGGRLISGDKDPADAAACGEMLFKFDPDIIIDDTASGEINRPSWWKELNAVKNGKVYETPYDDEKAWFTNWLFQSHSPLGAMWLAKKIHPDLFADVDLRKEQEEFYTAILGKPFTHRGTGFN